MESTLTSASFATPVAALNPSFERSEALRERFHAAIPGGAHTYAKGDDQFPEHMAPYIVRGEGCRVWDLDGNEYVEFGAGLRSVALGHAYPPVVAAAAQELSQGCNFGRPAVLELETAEEFLDFTKAGDMVKFAKNGSDVTSAAVKLARAYTGRHLVAICQDHPFFSVDDWFIGTTAVGAGIPPAIRNLTLGFRYNDLSSLAALLSAHPGQVACVLMEVEKEVPPAPGFLEGVQALCRREGVVLIFDEIITGFRWHNQGAQGFYGVRPDLSTFGKALGNGFSVAALAGRRELMERGGLHHPHERVFLLSTTYGAETHALAAARAVMQVYRQEPVVEHLRHLGQQLADGLHQSAREHGLGQQVQALGQPCCLIYTTRDAAGQHSAALRTLFLQETMRRGLLMPSLIVNYSHTEAIIGHVLEQLHEVLGVYRRALDEGVEKYLRGQPVKSVYRRYN
ncbi:glutamate-1-semialdehyde 2,1-aminomutase [Hymenobacter luteus]|uniref:Glutamate-1-semialdehyde 2,1-aminomutase n=2 Tax=Hymenobacter TaxID=89966 RepID=A0A7W9SZG9_9BACT|nr:MULTISPECIES: glutamate-1-semialdehyde 2,1-aminomutase [Hymenobacter]MBB4601073.1 glutamate-1-semialdehyde 2,1-aminomutase [Hymenobacter latericoloratus]MBB6058720.1 glutamate-1-semialdehyde 2,1-aminomutase [Hymenobacter luteus]